MTTTQAAERLQIAETILEQMGGKGRLIAMIGAYAFACIDNGLQFHFKAPARSREGIKVNLIQVTLEPSDTYNVKTWYFNKRTLDCEVVATCADVYCEDLISTVEGMTGLGLHL